MSTKAAASIQPISLIEGQNRAENRLSETKEEKIFDIRSFSTKRQNIFSRNFPSFSYDKEIGGIFIKIRMYFSIIVRKKRKELGLSQEKVAEYAGMTAQMYREIEKRKRSTAWEKWILICMILHIGIDDILSLQKLLLAEDENKKELIKWLKISENASTQKAQDKTLH